MAEMKHVLERIGDTLKDTELKQFFDLVDNGSEYVNIDEIIGLLKPQTAKDMYSKSIPMNVKPINEDEF